MKLTWFGGTALRIHIGARILVCDPDAANPGVDRTELASGADCVFAGAGELTRADPGTWEPRRPVALIDETTPADVLVHAVGPGSVLIDSVGEPPVLILSDALTSAGRWRTDAVVVAFDASTALAATALNPRLIALAIDGASLDPAIESMRDRLGGTSLVALEPGLALEI